MKCKVCNYDWCWLCENECPPNHYFIPGTPCYGKQFNDMDLEDFEMMRLLQDMNHPLANYFFIFLFSFFIISSTIRNLRYRNNREHIVNKNLVLFVLTCFLTVLAVLLALSNGIVLVYMLVNITKIATIRQISAKALCSASFLVLWILFYITGFLITAFWLAVSILYLIYKLVTL